MINTCLCNVGIPILWIQTMKMFNLKYPEDEGEGLKICCFVVCFNPQEANEIISSLLDLSESL